MECGEHISFHNRFIVPPIAFDVRRNVRGNVPALLFGYREKCILPYGIAYYIRDPSQQ